jgi:Immunity protein Imm5
MEVVVPVPAHLADRVREALGALYRHPDQTLLAWYRYAIYDALLADRSGASYAARAWIDVLSVQHVVFCWQSYARLGWPATWLQPTDLLELAEQTLEGMVDPAVIQRQITRAQALADVVGEPASSAQYPVWCVFEAALRALQSAWIYHAHGATTAAPNNGATGAVGLDDASRYAAIAIAGSPTPARGDPQTRTTLSGRNVAPTDVAAQLRRTFFWEWWLREAIPQAWQRR